MIAQLHLIRGVRHPTTLYVFDLPIVARIRHQLLLKRRHHIRNKTCRLRLVGRAIHHKIIIAIHGRSIVHHRLRHKNHRIACTSVADPQWCAIVNLSVAAITRHRSAHINIAQITHAIIAGQRTHKRLRVHIVPVSAAVGRLHKITLTAAQTLHANSRVIRVVMTNHPSPRRRRRLNAQPHVQVGKKHVLLEPDWMTVSSHVQLLLVFAVKLDMRASHTLVRHTNQRRHTAIQTLKRDENVFAGRVPHVLHFRVLRVRNHTRGNRRIVQGNVARERIHVT
mmetsp:Transcript_45277/g.75118  ORF Transcript_45277/g.75118 Transcript_45277/m.75118 type:complete len:280 (-) Transcript_45277:452-1291(-)